MLEHEGSVRIPKISCCQNDDLENHIKLVVATNSNLRCKHPLKLEIKYLTTSYIQQKLNKQKFRKKLPNIKKNIMIQVQWIQLILLCKVTHFSRKCAIQLIHFNGKKFIMISHLSSVFYFISIFIIPFSFGATSISFTKNIHTSISKDTTCRNEHLQAYQTDYWSEVDLEDNWNQTAVDVVCFPL